MKVYLSGIAGTGMSSLAGLFKQSGYDVAGSDNHFYPPVGEILRNMGIQTFEGYSAKNIASDIDFFVIGNVIGRGNPEAEHILNEGLEYYSMAEALHRFFLKGRQPVVVAGTHGKTTISAFIAHMLHQAELDPGFFIGGKPHDFSENYRLGRGKYFVLEGDEYETAFFDRSSKFLKYFPQYLVLTALEYDHLDFFKSEAAYLSAFQNLVNQVPQNGFIIYNADFELARRAAERSFAPTISYGSANQDFVIREIAPVREGYAFSLEHQGRRLSLQISIPGLYNVWNVAASVILGLKLGISEEILRRAALTFSGVERRLTQLNRIENTIFLEDFAHHPTAIRSVLQSLRQSHPGKQITCLFEPRSWSLRRNFFQDRLAESFREANRLLITDVYEKEKIPEKERLDVLKLRNDLQKHNVDAQVVAGFDAMKSWIRSLDTKQNHLVIILSNGSFGGLPQFIREL